MRQPEQPHPLVLRAESSRLSSAAIEALADELPADEAQVDSLVKESIDGYFARAFTTTTLAALHRGVPVDALHLVTGARLLPDPGFLGKLSVYMAGDVVGALVGAVADGRLSWQKEAVALFLAAHWSREKGLDTHRAEIVRRTRMCARVASGIEVHAFVAATADVLEDDQLSRLLAQMPSGRILQTARTWSERFLEVALAPVLEGLDDDEDEAGTHATQRRAVERVGRNEPCPCGSGRKYKRCCETKDRERLRDSSDVPGVTRTELRLHLEDHLTGERIHSLRAHDLARLDPKRIDPQLRGMILNRLIQFEEFDALVNYFETMGVARDQMHLLDAVSAALRAGKPDMARTLVKLAPDLGEDWLSFREHLLVKGVERFPALDLLEAEARRWIDESAVGVACDLLQGPWPSVGILVARGAAPLAEPWDRTMLLQEIGLARDRLELPALDPTEGLEDIWGWGEETEHFTDSSPLAEPAPEARGSGPDDDETQRRLETKEAEVARLRQELSDLHARLDERLSEAAKSDVDASPAAEAIPANDPRVAKLKERVDRLRSELSQRHSERNQLRRQLASSLKRVDTLEAEREKIGRPPEGEADDDSDCAPVETPIALSFRVPVFSERFRSSADKVPDPIRRRAVIVASRIAAGDESAFRGTRRLRRDRDLFRQRLGREHRLIFKLHAQELEAVDVVPRKDLERAIRELARH